MRLLRPKQQLGPNQEEKNPDEDAEELLRQLVQELLRNIGTEEGEWNTEDECDQEVLL